MSASPEAMAAALHLVAPSEVGAVLHRQIAIALDAFAAEAVARLREAIPGDKWDICRNPDGLSYRVQDPTSPTGERWPAILMPLKLAEALASLAGGEVKA